MATAIENPILSEELLTRCAERAPAYDRENRFFQEDFDELREAGYLKIAVPEELGGGGLLLHEVMELQRRLGYYAPATALGINMHLYWTGLVADLYRLGDQSLRWLLEETAAGEVFAAGHAESGNDVPVLYSTTKATKVEGGYRFTGRKSFGSLTPVWTRLGIHGIDASDPDHPKIVHGFMPRDSEGYAVEQVWDALGMRATASEDTKLDGAFVPDRYIARVVAPGAAGVDGFILGIFAWGLLGFANVYCGMAQRALDLVLEKTKKKKSVALSRSMAYHAEVQHAIAEMVMDLESVVPHLDRIARDWSEGVEHGVLWPSKIVTAKHKTVEAAWRVIDRGLEVLGGFGILRAAGYERLIRDGRLGRIHPANAFLTREFVAKTALGIDFDEAPRWG